MDIDHYYGGDVSFANGDLVTSDVDIETQQKIIRALLTNDGDYLWHSYGVGVGACVGDTSNKLSQLKGVCIAQVQSVEGVASSPIPSVTFQMTGNVLTTVITYTDATTGTIKSFSFNIEE